jgi:hypothetical protein
VRRGTGLYLSGMLLRRRGLLVVAFGALRYGLSFVHAGMPHETVATIERAWAGHGTCVARRDPGRARAPVHGAGCGRG